MTKPLHKMTRSELGNEARRRLYSPAVTARFEELDRRMREDLRRDAEAAVVDRDDLE